MKTSKQIAGIELALEAGTVYMASRDAVSWSRQDAFPIYIRSIVDPFGEPVLTLPAMTYDDANAFLAEFNNGVTSFDGRVW